MTPQEQNQRSFDMVAVALVKQGRPSYVEVPPNVDELDFVACRYRGPDGIRCAAGWLFEGEAGKDFEEGAFATAPNIYALLKASGHDPYFVSDLQEAHDDAARSCQGRPGPWLKEWADDMRCIAYDHGLSTAALDAALAARSTGE